MPETPSPLADLVATAEAVEGRQEAPAGLGSTPSPVGARFAAAATTMVAGKVLAVSLIGVPVLSLLAVTSVVFFAVGALFGWVGLAAAVVVQVGYTLVQFGLAPRGWIGLLPYAATGAVGWLLFRYVPGVGRAFPNLATLKWFTVAAAATGLLSSGFISLASGHWLDAVAVWARSTIVSLWLFTPPLLILGASLIERWLAPIPGEVSRPLPRQVALALGLEKGAGLEDVDLRTRPVSTLRVAVQCALAASLVMAGTVTLGWGPALLWWNLLYLAPIWWAANRLRLRGGLVAAGMVGILSLVGHAVIFSGPGVPPDLAVGIYGQILLLWVFGALLGLAAERETDLVDGLVEVNSRLRRDLQRVVRALTGALQAKDEYTEGHLYRVHSYAVEVGRRLGLEFRDLELLQIASTLHDVGKIGIPEAILNKPGPLDAEEWAAMRRHPEIGARLLSTLDGIRDAAPMVLHHQERWDGRVDGRFPGYPGGLAGEEIPLGARIIAVVDSFDAMTTDRPYRSALPEEEARRVLLRERGGQFDPKVVDSFLEILDQSPWQAAG